MTAYPTASELLVIMAQTKFEPFTDADWEAFMGCESDTPYIGYYKDFTIVLDGDQINMIQDGDEFGGELYQLGKGF